MASFAGICVDDALVIYLINSYFPRCMNNFMLIEQNTYVYDLSFGIIKECKVAANYFLQKTDGFPLPCLLRCIPQQWYAETFVHNLRKAAAINVK